MDLESFETIELPVSDAEVLNELVEGENCEYWDVEGEKLIKKVM